MPCVSLLLSTFLPLPPPQAEAQKAGREAETRSGARSWDSTLDSRALLGDLRWRKRPGRARWRMGQQEAGTGGFGVRPRVTLSALDRNRV